jgi:hypothetical protein
LRSLPEIAEALRILSVDEVDLIEGRERLLRDRDRRTLERERSEAGEHENPRGAQHQRFSCEHE